LAVSCPDGSVLMGGGGRVEPLGDDSTTWVGLVGSFPARAGAGGAWQAEAQVSSVGGEGAITFRFSVYAVCSEQPAGAGRGR
jgi:hypothetical protein